MTLPVPSQRSWTVGDIVTAAEMNSDVRDSVNFLSNTPIFVGYQSTTQTIANGTYTAIALNAHATDTYGGHSNSTNNSRYAAQVAGWYLVLGHGDFVANSTGDRRLKIQVNGADPSQNNAIEAPNNGSAGWQGDTATIVFLNVGDYVETVIMQNSGASLATGALGSMCVIWMHS